MASEVLSAIKTMALPGAGSKAKSKGAGPTKPHPTAADPPQGVSRRREGLMGIPIG